MLPTLAQRLEQGARRLIPFVSTLILIFMGSMAWPLPYFGSVAPSLGLIAVYYWSIHRPDLFRPLSAFALGLLYDIVHFLPLGLTAFIFVFVHHIVLSQRRFFVGHAFFMLWSGFALIMVLVMLGNWLILSLFNSHWMTFLPVFLQGILTVIVFPLPVWVLIVIQRHWLSQV